ncbi:hypothetical protein ADK86_28200 [Streptomyces sp. NRRL F-5755]|nr:hypothetical protein ADK86_28200 [Streptomyces sp. NRRL F-5755]
MDRPQTCRTPPPPGPPRSPNRTTRGRPRKTVTRRPPPERLRRSRPGPGQPHRRQPSRIRPPPPRTCPHAPPPEPNPTPQVADTTSPRRHPRRAWQGPMRRPGPVRRRYPAPGRVGSGTQHRTAAAGGRTVTAVSLRAPRPFPTAPPRLRTAVLAPAAGARTRAAGRGSTCRRATSPTGCRSR